MNTKIRILAVVVILAVVGAVCLPPPANAAGPTGALLFLHQGRFKAQAIRVNESTIALRLGAVYLGPQSGNEAWDYHLAVFALGFTEEVMNQLIHPLPYIFTVAQGVRYLNEAEYRNGKWARSPDYPLWPMYWEARHWDLDQPALGQGGAGTYDAQQWAGATTHLFLIESTQALKVTELMVGMDVKKLGVASSLVDWGILEIPPYEDPTPTHTATSTTTTTATATATASPTSTGTETSTATWTPTATKTPTATVTVTASQTGTATSTATWTPTATSTEPPPTEVLPETVAPTCVVTPVHPDGKPRTHSDRYYLVYENDETEALTDLQYELKVPAWIWPWSLDVSAWYKATIAGVVENRYDGKYVVWEIPSLLPEQIELAHLRYQTSTSAPVGKVEMFLKRTSAEHGVEWFRFCVTILP